jgi:Rrf2 family protein
MYITAKIDYAMRVVVALAAQESMSMTATLLAHNEHLPLYSLKRLLAELRRSGILANSRRGETGYRLARPATAISIAEVFGALGPLLEFPVVDHGESQANEPVLDLEGFWFALDTSLRTTLEQISVADVAKGAALTELHRTGTTKRP